MSNGTDKPIKISLFHMENCSHCVAFKPEWEKLTANPQKNIAFADYESKQLGGLSKAERTINGEEVNGFPTIKINIFNEEYNYERERTQDSILRFIRDRLKNRDSGVETEMSDSAQFGGDENDDNSTTDQPEQSSPDVPSEIDIEAVSESTEPAEPDESESNEPRVSSDDIAAANATANEEEEKRRSSPEEQVSSSPDEKVSSPSIFTKDSSSSENIGEGENNADAVGGGIIRSEFDRLLMQEINALSEHPF